MTHLIFKKDDRKSLKNWRPISGPRGSHAWLSIEMTNPSRKSMTQNSGVNPSVNNYANAVPVEMDESVPQEAAVAQQQPAVSVEIMPTCDAPCLCHLLAPCPLAPSHLDLLSQLKCLPIHLLRLVLFLRALRLIWLIHLPSGVQIPSVLQSMCEDGARFCPATHCWAIASDGNIRVNREFSSSFSLNAQVSSVDVLEAFYCVGVGPEDVTCVQFNSPNHLWTVSFKDREDKYQLTGLHQILVKGHQCFMSDCDNHVLQSLKFLMLLMKCQTLFWLAGCVWKSFFVPA